MALDVPDIDEHHRGIVSTCSSHFWDCQSKPCDTSPERREGELVELSRGARQEARGDTSTACFYGVDLGRAAALGLSNRRKGKCSNYSPSRGAGELSHRCLGSCTAVSGDSPSVSRQWRHQSS
jgi:hypothetical protein